MFQENSDDSKRRARIWALILTEKAGRLDNLELKNECDFRLTVWLEVHRVWDCEASNRNVQQASRKMGRNIIWEDRIEIIHGLDLIHTEVQFGAVKID